MGHIKHHAIAVTSWDESKLDLAYKKAKDIFGDTVSDMVGGVVNSFRSFFIAPDGSKEGWAESNIGDEKRAAFVDYLISFQYEDGSSPIDYCEFYYGDDNGKSEVVNYNKR